MTKRKARQGAADITYSHPFDAMLASLDGAGAKLVREFRDRARARYERAFAEWPVKTGKSRAGLRWAGGLDGGGNVYARVWHETTGETAYTQYVYIRDRNAIRRIDRAARRFLRDGRTRRKHGARRYARVELLVKPWSRDDEPRLWLSYQWHVFQAVKGG